MNKRLVCIVKYEKPLESVRKAVELSQGLDHLPSKAKVFIKPNIVWWTSETVVDIGNCLPEMGNNHNIQTCRRHGCSS
jgi:hypothetical protein